ncbi:serine hydrolase domain-containing protein [Mucilaginibacter aquaedulcis]|uniref:serine hydrolase domain-containing protein n=1 Tax=Mucilaginibacter aquaedulcis TaxID=1187081 RepID=UPI0025B2AE8A|nr:serine hydrolase domain-containing protein [Mucilaginibacter aquaedulcis]MDN3548625.1 serine hydrolase domain-containing protein [Mucilaginibacter aquaedulcis]
MKRILLITVIILMIARSKSGAQTNQPCNFPNEQSAFSKRDTLEKLSKQYTQMGIPGLVLAVYSPGYGYWGTASGFSETETHTPMQLCMLQYLQSVSKTYLATVILKLYEEGKIDLDAAITKYLPQQYSSYIDKASTMTVRNLLNHTSGMPDYLENPKYVSYALAHPDHIFTSDEFLSYIKGEPQQFKPGSKFQYSNTNYHVLALIVDVIAGSHDQLIRQKILMPLGLSHTFYRDIKGRADLVKNYIDLSGTGVVQNVTQLQQSSIMSAKGDDGIVATPLDAINFLRGLMEGKLLSKASLNEMTKWVNDDTGKPVYGMGLYHVTYSNVDGVGHGGAGAGAGCALYYFPSKNVYVFLATNIGKLVEGPIVRKVNELKIKVLEIILKD